MGALSRTTIPAAARRALAAALLGLSAAPSAAGICDGISPVSETPLASVRIASGLTKPCWVTAPAGDTHRVFIL